MIVGMFALITSFDVPSVPAMSHDTERRSSALNVPSSSRPLFCTSPRFTSFEPGNPDDGATVWLTISSIVRLLKYVKLSVRRLNRPGLEAELRSPCRAPDEGPRCRRYPA